jgi:hypothetical protein
MTPVRAKPLCMARLAAWSSLPFGGLLQVEVASHKDVLAGGAALAARMAAPAMGVSRLTKSCRRTR